MFIYAGIDEAGYGPMFGPLVIGATTLAIPKLDAKAPPPNLWQRLSKSVCRDLRSTKSGRLAVNDSKKLKTKAAGLRHLELGCLAFANLAGYRPTTVNAWLDALGETAHHDLAALPWYADHPAWAGLPGSVTEGELAVTRSMLRATCDRIGVEVRSISAAVVLEDRFNRMVGQTRSKAATSFTFVARHLRSIWDAHAEHHPTVVIDRQGGRTRYRQLLAETIPEASVRVIQETPQAAAYELTAGSSASHNHGMTIRFQPEAEANHMPVALASMLAKYTRELMMSRFNAWFTRQLPDLAPTAGYGTDAQRFWRELQPHLPALGLENHPLKRIA